MSKDHPEHILPMSAHKMGIDTHQELTVYLRADSHVCRSEGFSALSRVKVESEQNKIIATLHIANSGILKTQEIGFSNSAWEQMQLNEGVQITVSHPRPVESLSHVRAKVFGHKLDREQLYHIVEDIVAGRYADVHLAAFITACSNNKLDTEEIVHLTDAMVKVGSRIEWQQAIIADKHCVGGLPGNRTTPIIVSILAASGLHMPKTSSRAITSPAGTADTMETLTEVSLSIEQIQNVVKQEGGCLAWGGSVKLSPADDLLIRVERALDIDNEGQLIASVLSKKIAAGATHVLIDIPVGPTAKVRDRKSADRLSGIMKTVAETLGLTIKVMITDGSQPVGRGIGPALEAADILAVLKNKPEAPQDLKDRSAALAGALLELCGKIAEGKGYEQALSMIETGAAWEKFQTICLAQGGLKQPAVAPYRYNYIAEQGGHVVNIDNRQLSQLAKLAGAPADPAAGVVIYTKLGEQVEVGETMLTLHAESPGELEYAVEYLNDHRDLIIIE